MTRARAEPERRAPAPRSRARTARWTAGSRTTPRSRPPAAGLELGLDERDDRAAGRLEASRRSAPRTSRSEMNDTSTTARSTGSGRRPGRRASGRSCAPSRRPGDRGGAIRRAARDPRRRRRRGARRAASRTSVKPPVEAPDVEADQTRRVDPEGVERGRELVAAAADTYGSRSTTAIVRGRVDEVAGLAVEPRRVALPHPDLAGQDQRLRPAPASRPGRAPRGAGRGASGRTCGRRCGQRCGQTCRSGSCRRSPAYRGTPRFAAAHRAPPPGVPA